MALIASVAIVAWCCVRKRNSDAKREKEDLQPNHSMSMASASQPPPVVYVQPHELPDDDPQKQAYNWKGGLPSEALSTPVAELPAGHTSYLPGDQLYDDSGFLHDNERISPQPQYHGYSPAQETLVQTPSTPGAISSPGRHSATRSPAQTSQGYAPSSFSPGQSPQPNQEYFAPPPEPASRAAPQGHYAPNGQAYGRWEGGH